VYENDETYQLDATIMIVASSWYVSSFPDVFVFHLGSTFVPISKPSTIINQVL